ncbi:hypothetical protein D3C72_2424110 [compost metagenome]
MSLRSASRAKSIIMIAFFLTMPISSKMPTIAMKVSCMFMSLSASSAPTAAEGMPARIVTG